MFKAYEELLYCRGKRMITSWNEYRIVNDSLDELVEKAEVDPEIRQMLKYTLCAGGKRSRPIIVLLSTEICGGDARDSINAALAIELVHTVSLIQDDILDKGERRRGRESAHEKFGPGFALLCGDLLISKAVEMISHYEKPIVQDFARAGLLMSEGEILDVKKRKDKISRKEYYECISKKTASLFAASASIGGIIARGRRDAIVEKLTRFGNELGMAYQIVDDLLEFLETQKKAKTKFLPPFVTSAANSPDEVVSATMAVVEQHSRRAKDQIAGFGECGAREKLSKLVDVLTIDMVDKKQ